MEYETNDEIRSYVRSLPALAFVPPDDVKEAFERLAESQPTTVAHLDELTWFFEHTYIRGLRRRGRAATYAPAAFPVATWNQHAAGSDGIAPQHQQRREVAPRAEVTVPVSPPIRVDLHQWDSAGHPSPESTVSVGYDWSKPPIRKKISCIERSYCAFHSYARLHVAPLNVARLSVAPINCRPG